MEDDVLVLDEIEELDLCRPSLSVGIEEASSSMGRPMHYMPVSNILKRIVYRRQQARHSQLVRDVVLSYHLAPAPKTKPRSKSI